MPSCSKKPTTIGLFVQEDFIFCFKEKIANNKLNYDCKLIIIYIIYNSIIYDYEINKYVTLTKV